MKEIEEYIERLKLQNKSINTIDAYSRDLFRFRDFLIKEDLTLDKFEELQIVNFTEYLMIKGISKSSIIRNLVTIRNLYKFLRREGYILEAPILYYELPHLDKVEPHVLTKEEVDALMDSPSAKRPRGIRDKAILELLYATGIKVNELINLKLKDINLDENYIITCGSKDKVRLIPFNQKASSAIKNYLNVRKVTNADWEDILFLSTHGGFMTRQGVWKMLKSYLNKIGITKEVNLNTLRHSFAVHILENGANIEAVKDMLGHSTINETLKYRELQKKNKLLEIYKNSHLRE